jgi:hypothetical protein
MKYILAITALINSLVFFPVWGVIIGYFFEFESMFLAGFMVPITLLWTIFSIVHICWALIEFDQ